LDICDSNFNWNGWYRLLYYGMSVRMPESCVNVSRCGTYTTLWLTGSHPQIEDGIVTRGVCGRSGSDCCYYRFIPIRVKACPGNYYVYEFVRPTICSAAYCADVNAITPTTAPTPPTGPSIITSSPNNMTFDPCSVSTVLDNSWRNTGGFYYSGYRGFDDTLIEWSGWYRLYLQGKSAQIPESDWCASYMTCGGYTPLLLGGSHPRLQDGIVTREIYGSYGYVINSSQCNSYRSNSIQVKACPGNYYVYRLVKPALSFPMPTYCAVVLDSPNYDPCNIYTALDQPWRATNAPAGSNCDNSFNGNVWYRMLYNGMNIRMSDSCVNRARCGTDVALWLNGSHPQIEDGIVTHLVCGSSGSDCCYYRSIPIRVKACPGNYYVYEFVRPTLFCNALQAVYCADVNTITSVVTPTTTAIGIELTSTPNVTTIIPVSTTTLAINTGLTTSPSITTAIPAAETTDVSATQAPTTTATISTELTTSPNLRTTEFTVPTQTTSTELITTPNVRATQAPTTTATISTELTTSPNLRTTEFTVPTQTTSTELTTTPNVSTTPVSTTTLTISTEQTTTTQVSTLSGSTTATIRPELTTTSNGSTTTIPKTTASSSTELTTTTMASTATTSAVITDVSTTLLSTTTVAITPELTTTPRTSTASTSAETTDVITMPASTTIVTTTTKLTATPLASTETPFAETTDTGTTPISTSTISTKLTTTPRTSTAATSAETTDVSTTPVSSSTISANLTTSANVSTTPFSTTTKLAPGQTITMSPQCQGNISAECADDIFHQISNSTNPVLSPEIVKKVLQQQILNVEVLNADQPVSIGNTVLNKTEILVSTLVNPTETMQMVNISLNDLEIRVFAIGPRAFLKENPMLSINNTQMDIDLIGISQNNNGSAAVAFMSYTSMVDILSPKLFNPTKKTEKIMMSTVLSATLPKTTNTQLPTPVNFTIKHIEDLPPNSNLFCVYWNHSEWIVDGCYLLQTNISHSVCSCFHLSTFALIVQVNPPEKDSDPVMDLINIIAVAVGLLFLCLTLLTFALCQWNPRVTNTALTNLCISLLLAHLLFLLTQTFLKYIQPRRNGRTGESSRHMWSGLRTITDYKEGVICDRGSSSSLADNCNAHYVHFGPNTSPAEKLQVEEESCAPAIPLSEVVKSFWAVNPHKAPGPDGIHKRVLKTCAIQLAETFTDVFNLSLRLSVI
ncbi:uncharacterized protein LOC108443879, partial [Pygocentrus nattereri]|uniref:uncharacterized protein LOC108443879 n=1 Tax=Pygocentrus nattereri TaxID=42514 RepID=UPI0018914B8B